MIFYWITIWQPVKQNKLEAPLPWDQMFDMLALLLNLGETNIEFSSKAALMQTLIDEAFPNWNKVFDYSYSYFLWLFPPVFFLKGCVKKAGVHITPQGIQEQKMSNLSLL